MIKALYHADRLETFARDGDMAWVSHAGQLDDLGSEINDIDQKLCRLETIRRVLAPWQQRAVDQVAIATRLLAENANPQGLYFGAYGRYVNNLYGQAKSLTRSVGSAVGLARASNEHRDLKQNLGARASS